MYARPHWPASDFAAWPFVREAPRSAAFDIAHRSRSADRNHERRRERKVEAETGALDRDVARQPAPWQLGQPRPQQTRDDHRQTENEEQTLHGRHVGSAFRMGVVVRRVGPRHEHRRKQPRQRARQPRRLRQHLPLRLPREVSNSDAPGSPSNASQASLPRSRGGPAWPSRAFDRPAKKPQCMPPTDGLSTASFAPTTAAPCRARSPPLAFRSRRTCGTGP